MSMISEQVTTLREISTDTEGCCYPQEYLQKVIREAADTIEVLSAKLQAVNVERTAEDCGKSVLKIDTPKACIDCPCHFAGESGMVMCGVDKRELLSDDIQTFKPDWCPLRESAGDCGGWIYCGDGKNLPEEKINPITKDFFEYQVTFKSEDVTDIRHYKFGRGHWWNGPGIMDEYVIAWRQNLEPYHEP